MLSAGLQISQAAALGCVRYLVLGRCHSFGLHLSQSLVPVMAMITLAEHLSSRAGCCRRCNRSMRKISSYSYLNFSDCFNVDFRQCEESLSTELRSNLPNRKQEGVSEASCRKQRCRICNMLGGKSKPACFEVSIVSSDVAACQKRYEPP